MQRSLIFLCILVQLPGCTGTRKKMGTTVSIRDHHWSVEIAATEEEQTKGLSGRSNLAEDEGMLFTYPSSRIRSFCMRGCKYPLDIIFINDDKQVINTLEMQVEDDLVGRKSYTSNRPARYVLEIRGGSVSKTGIIPGDKVIISGL